MLLCFVVPLSRVFVSSLKHLKEKTVITEELISGGMIVSHYSMNML